MWPGDNHPSASVLNVTAHEHGIIIGEIVSEPTSFLAPSPAGGNSGGGSSGGDASGGKLPPGSPGYSVPPPSPGSNGRFEVVQLWGLKHCVEPALERVAAMQSNHLVASLTLGPAHVGTLKGLVPLQELPETRVSGKPASGRSFCFLFLFGKGVCVPLKVGVVVKTYTMYILL